MKEIIFAIRRHWLSLSARTGLFFVMCTRTELIVQRRFGGTRLPLSSTVKIIRTGRCGRLRGFAVANATYLGLMPHPERAVESPLGSSDGLVIFQSMVEYLTRGERKASGNRVAVTA